MSIYAAGAIAVSSIYSAHQAGKSADKATKAGKEASKRQLAFDQQTYDDWQETYGPIQDNLADYYANLTPEYFEAQGLENYQKEQQASMQRIEENFAQRGIVDSGIAASVRKSAEFERAEARADIRTDAPLRVAEEKRNFLQVGLGQNPAGNVSAGLRSEAANLSATARVAEQSAGAATGDAIKVAGTALGDYMNRPKQATPAPTTGYTMSDGEFNPFGD